MRPISRNREVLVGLFCLSAAVLAGCSPSSDSQAEAPSVSEPQPAPPPSTETATSQPNIVLIMADDMGWSDIGAYGGEIETPNLDRLAEESLMMTRFYSGLTCSPTRAMMLSGVDNHLSGIGNMREIQTPNQIGLPGYEGYLTAHTPSLAERLNAAGYRSYISGKWHLGGARDLAPDKRGFDRSFVMVPGAGTHFNDPIDNPVVLIDNIPPVPQWRADGEAVYELPEHYFSSEYFTEQMIGFVEENRDTPFFAYLAFTAPHWPLQAPDSAIKEYRGRYNAGWDIIRAERFARQQALGLVEAEAELPPRARRIPAWEDLPPPMQADLARRMEVYAAMVDNMDANIGLLIDYLKRRDLYDNTIIIFLSDNGGDPADHTNAMLGPVAAAYDNSLDNMGLRDSFVAYGPGWAQVSNTPWAGFKSTGLEGGSRVPMLISHPEFRDTMVRSNMAGRMQDIHASVLAWAGLPIQPENATHPVQGRSLMPLFSEPDTAIYGDDEALGFETNMHRVVRMGDWALVGNVAGPGRFGGYTLFNLAEDPFQQNDLSAENPEQLAEMIAAWDSYVENNNVVPPVGLAFDPMGVNPNSPPDHENTQSEDQP